MTERDPRWPARFEPQSGRPFVPQFFGLDCAIHTHEGRVAQTSIVTGILRPVVRRCHSLIKPPLRIDDILIGTFSDTHVEIAQTYVVALADSRAGLNKVSRSRGDIGARLIARARPHKA